ncbi:MAG: HNH endonuclease [Christensenellaceae bacterium]|nr:HNH endonuclease [Christensenellaceae bacterium]
MIIKGISAIINSRNYYPQKTIEYNITNKRKISADTMVDNWIIQNGIEPVELHIKDIEQWKKTKIDTFKGNARKIEKFNARCALNKGKAFRFVSYRMQTRYQQVNYKKYPYQVRVNNEDVCVSEAFMLERIDFLKKHDFNITYNQYHAVDQRKVLTKSMREQVKRRDNWTCQLCGKIMRDGVGLHIDHIVPISRGGKSMLANLRVLCSKCNGSKGGRLDGDEERDDFYEKDELY